MNSSTDRLNLTLGCTPYYPCSTAPQNLYAIAEQEEPLNLKTTSSGYSDRDLEVAFQHVVEDPVAQQADNNLINAEATSSNQREDNQDQRQTWYHRRYHFDTSSLLRANELKNKNHFSVTGDTGKSALVRKVSFTSHSPTFSSTKESLRLKPDFPKFNPPPLNCSSFSYNSNVRYSPTLQQHAVSPPPVVRFPIVYSDAVPPAFLTKSTFYPPSKKMEIDNGVFPGTSSPLKNNLNFSTKSSFQDLEIGKQVEIEFQDESMQEEPSPASVVYFPCKKQSGLKRKASAAFNKSSNGLAAGMRLSPQRPRKQFNPLFSLPWFKPITPGKSVKLEDHKRSFREKYNIKQKMGAGGGGTVFAGFRKSDNFGVAIKKINKAKVTRWGLIKGQLVPEEFELLYRAGKTGNNCIIKMYEWYESRNSYMLVMERPQPAIDLFDYLQQQQMSEPFVRNIFRQLVKAVMTCHDVGIVHRDIKDENVLLNLHTGEPKLIDFGCGTFDKGTSITDFAGTKEFYPPEWFTKQKYYGKELDTWSLGVLLYTMLQSRIPFSTPQEIVKCRFTFTTNCNLSPMCCDLIRSILRFDRSKRLTLNEVMNHPWMTEISIPPCPMVINMNREEVSDQSSSATDLTFPHQKSQNDVKRFPKPLSRPPPSNNGNQDNDAYSSTAHSFPTYSNLQNQDCDGNCHLADPFLIASQQQAQNNDPHSPSTTYSCLSNPGQQVQDENDYPQPYRLSYEGDCPYISIRSSPESPSPQEKISDPPLKYCPLVNEVVVNLDFNEAAFSKRERVCSDRTIEC